MFALKWTGPHPIVEVKGDNVYLVDQNGNLQPVHVDDLKTPPPTRRRAVTEDDDPPANDDSSADDDESSDQEVPYVVQIATRAQVHTVNTDPPGGDVQQLHETLRPRIVSSSPTLQADAIPSATTSHQRVELEPSDARPPDPEPVLPSKATWAKAPQEANA